MEFPRQYQAQDRPASTVLELSLPVVSPQHQDFFWMEKDLGGKHQRRRDARIWDGGVGFEKTIDENGKNEKGKSTSYQNVQGM